MNCGRLPKIVLFGHLSGAKLKPSCPKWDEEFIIKEIKGNRYFMGGREDKK